MLPLILTGVMGSAIDRNFMPLGDQPARDLFHERFITTIAGGNSTAAQQGYFEAGWFRHGDYLGTCFDGLRWRGLNIGGRVVGLGRLDGGH